MSISGLATPDSIDSVPMTWATTSWTHHPGSAVGNFHCASGRPVISRSMTSHDAKSPSRTSDLSRWVAGREGLFTARRYRPDRLPVSRSRSFAPHHRGRRYVAADDQGQHGEQRHGHPIGHQHHPQGCHPPRCHATDEVADAVTERRHQREDDPDQVMPLARRPSSLLTSLSASRLAMSCRLSCVCLPRASASSTLTLPSVKYSDSGTNVRLPSRILPTRLSISPRCNSNLRLRRGAWLVQLPA